MSKKTNVLVAVDLSSQDEHIESYVKFLSSIIHFDKVTFLHVSKDFDLPDELKEYNLDAQHLTKLIQEKVEKIIPNPNFEIEYVVIKGTPLNVLLSWAKEKNISLCVLGRKSSSKSTGSLLNRLARRFHGDLLIVPEKEEYSMKKIMVCNDFSKNAMLTFQKAIDLAEQTEGCEVNSVHFYSIPSGYTSTGTTKLQMSNIMKKNAEANFEKQLAQIDTKNQEIVFKAMMQTDKSAEMVKKVVRKFDYDMLMIGSKGRTFAASIFLGSFAEKVIMKGIKTPLYICKQARETLGILEAISRL